MTIVIDKKTDIAALKKELANSAKKRGFNAKKYAGKIKWGEEALAYQKRMRNK